MSQFRLARLIILGCFVVITFGAKLSQNYYIFRNDFQESGEESSEQGAGEVVSIEQVEDPIEPDSFSYFFTLNVEGVQGAQVHCFLDYIDFSGSEKLCQFIKTEFEKLPLPFKNGLKEVAGKVFVNPERVDLNFDLKMSLDKETQAELEELTRIEETRKYIAKQDNHLWEVMSNLNKWCDCIRILEKTFINLSSLESGGETCKIILDITVAESELMRLEMCHPSKSTM